MNPRDVVTDACSMLNLLATGRSVEIIRAVGFRLLIVDLAAGEVRCLVGSPDGEGNCPEIPVDLTPLMESGVLRVIAADEISADNLVDAAARLADVDALGVALARQLGHALLSDDGKVRRVFGELCPASELHSSLQVVRRATKLLSYPDRIIRELLRAMRHAANFDPPRLDPERDWFRRYLEGV